jgi:hypothetical protein
MAERAIELFHEVTNPDEILLNLLFNACAQLGTKKALVTAKQVAEQMPKIFYSNPFISSSLLAASMKCGDIQYAKTLFDQSTKKVLPMYATMMRGY